MDDCDDLDAMASADSAAPLVEQLAMGEVEPSDAPAGLGWVVHLMKTAQGPITPEELDARDATVTAFAARVRTHPLDPARRRRIIAGSRFATKVGAVAAPIILVAGVAAATGSLPPSAQAPLAKALSHLGISVPDPQPAHHGSAGSPHSNAGGTGTRTGPDAGPTSPATRGLCTAWTAGGLDRHSTAYRNLTSAAGGEGNLPAYCRGVLATHGGSTGSGHVDNQATNHPGTGNGATTSTAPGKTQPTLHGTASNPGADLATKSGRCTAWAAGGLAVNSTAYRSLSAAAGGAGSIAAYCGLASASSNAAGSTGTTVKASAGPAVNSQGSPGKVPTQTQGPSTLAGHGGPPPSPPGRAGKPVGASKVTKPSIVASSSVGAGSSCTHVPVGNPRHQRHCPDPGAPDPGGPDPGGPDPGGTNPGGSGGSGQPPASVHHPAPPPGWSHKSSVH